MQGDGARTSITLDFGDGHALTYSNVSSIEDGIKHIYKVVGIYRVTATGENSLGSETAVLYLHVTCEILTKFEDFCVNIFLCIYLDRTFFHFCALAYSSLCFPLFITLSGTAAVSSHTVYRILYFISSQNVPSHNQTNK